MPHALPAPLTPPADAGPANAVGSNARWEGEGRQWRLVLAGDWTGDTECPKPPAGMPVEDGTPPDLVGQTAPPAEGSA